MLDIMVRIYGTPSVCLGKLSFDQILDKTPLEILAQSRLLRFQLGLISW